MQPIWKHSFRKIILKLKIIFFPYLLIVLLQNNLCCHMTILTTGKGFTRQF